MRHCPSYIPWSRRQNTPRARRVDGYLTAYPSCAPGDSAKAAASRLLTGVNPILERVRELQAEQAARIARKIDISRERLARDLDDATDIARRAGNAGVMVSSHCKNLRARRYKPRLQSNGLLAGTVNA
jgi:hypothetical protein